MNSQHEPSGFSQEELDENDQAERERAISEPLLQRDACLSEADWAERQRLIKFKLFSELDEWMNSEHAKGASERILQALKEWLR